MLRYNNSDSDSDSDDHVFWRTESLIPSHSLAHTPRGSAPSTAAAAAASTSTPKKHVATSTITVKRTTQSANLASPTTAIVPLRRAKKSRASIASGSASRNSLVLDEATLRTMSELAARLSDKNAQPHIQIHKPPSRVPTSLSRSISHPVITAHSRNQSSAPAAVPIPRLSRSLSTTKPFGSSSVLPAAKLAISSKGKAKEEIARVDDEIDYFGTDEDDEEFLLEACSQVDLVEAHAASQSQSQSRSQLHPPPPLPPHRVPVPTTAANLLKSARSKTMTVRSPPVLPRLQTTTQHIIARPPRFQLHPARPPVLAPKPLVPAGVPANAFAFSGPKQIQRVQMKQQDNKGAEWKDGSNISIREAAAKELEGVDFDFDDDEF